MIDDVIYFLDKFLKDGDISNIKKARLLLDVIRINNGNIYRS